jgi:outer membrane receptor for monomeric catechols
MRSRILQLAAIAIVACLAHEAFARDRKPARSGIVPIRKSSTWSSRADVHKSQVTGRHAASRKQPKADQTLAADGDPYADPRSPYKANRLASSPNQPIINIPGQTTVLTRQILDDKNATSISDALRTTAGVTVGR